MSRLSFRGLMLNPCLDYSGFDVIEDGVIRIAESGIIEFAGAVSDFPVNTLPAEIQQPTQWALLPTTVNTHDHSFQPPAIPGSLIEAVGQGFEGWLPTTLQEGESVAKTCLDRARLMARARLAGFVKNGVGTVLQHTTSSADAARIVLEEADQMGIRVVVGYVAMNQGIEVIQKGLEETDSIIVQQTRSLLDDYGADRVCVIDRTPIAVSSPLRRQLTELAREYQALYETHCDESVGEKAIHQSLYGTDSIIQTLLDDGVFESGSRVGLAHAIHSTEREIDALADKITQGCELSIRACPNSNAQLGSHWHNQVYIPFPLQQWQQAGAIITLGTDQGAGRLSNLLAESYWERGRQPQEIAPMELLHLAVLNGLRSLRMDVDRLRMQVGNRADFMVIEMKGAGSFYQQPGRDVNRNVARIIEGGMQAEGIKAVFIEGRKIK